MTQGGPLASLSLAPGASPACLISLSVNFGIIRTACEGERHMSALSGLDTASGWIELKDPDRIFILSRLFHTIGHVSRQIL